MPGAQIVKYAVAVMGYEVANQLGWCVRNLKRGAIVIARTALDPEGARVQAGDLGVVFEETDAYGDGCGPVVRWIESGGMCNVYEGEVYEVLPKKGSANGT